MPQDQTRHGVCVAGILRIRDRPFDLAVRLRPDCGSRTTAATRLAGTVLSLGLKHSAKQAVVAEPGSIAVEGYQKQRGLLDLIDKRGGVVALQYEVTQRRRQFG